MYSMIMFQGKKLHCENLLKSDYLYDDEITLSIYKVLSGEIKHKYVVFTNRKDDTNSFISRESFDSDNDLIGYIDNKINQDDFLKIKNMR